DLTVLLAWLEQIVRQRKTIIPPANQDISPEVYNACQRVERTQDRLKGVLLLSASQRELFDSVRDILASGIVRWGCPDEMPPNAIPQQLLDLLRQRIVFVALWPLVIAPSPPIHWEYALKEITSSSIVLLTTRTHLQYLQA